MNKVEKIKDWISKTQDGLMDTQCNFGYPEHEGAYHILCNLDAYIDSLQEEPVSNDLEEAAHSYVDTTIEWFDSEGNPCCYPAFIAGAQWQKEQMMKNSTFINEVEWGDDIHKLFRGKGKKVKLAIIKDENY